jgi:hypothetical protein
MSISAEEKKKFFKQPLNIIQEKVNESSSFSELFQKFNIKRCSDFTERVKIFFSEKQIDFSHFNNFEKKNFLTGEKFGRWKIIERGNAPASWKCQCECGTIREVSQSHLVSGKSTGCIKCSKLNERSSQFTGYEEISGNRFSDIKHKAIKRNYEFSVTIEYIWNLFLLQERKCALSGVDICFGEKSKDYGTASLDRINNEKGYIEGNVQWLHKDINKMKNTHDQNYFLALCKKIAKFNNL